MLAAAGGLCAGRDCPARLCAERPAGWHRNRPQSAARIIRFTASPRRERGFAPHAETDQVVQLVCEQMEGAHKLNVPLKVDVESGPNWEEMHDVGTH